MKKYGFTLLAMFLFLLASQSCRDRTLNNPGEEKSEEIQQRRQQSMEKHKEWTESDEPKDSTNNTSLTKDTTIRDSMRPH